MDTPKMKPVEPAKIELLKLKQEFEALSQDRSQEEQVWDEIEKFIMPLSGATAEAVNGASADPKTSIQLWDLTAPLALDHMASSLHADLTSPSSRWLDLEWMDAELEQDHEAVKYRERLAELAWSELQASDFGMEIASAYQEWAGKGNMCVVTEPASTTRDDWKGFDFTAVPIAQVGFVEDSRGGLLRWYRKLRWTAAQCADHCTRQGYAPPKKIADLCEKPEGTTTKHNVAFAIYRRDGWAGSNAIAPELDGDAIATQRPYGCVYFMLDESCEQLGPEDGYYKMPSVMGRFGKRPGTPWGYGRGHIALRHVKWLNAFKELQRNKAELAVDPPLGVSERVQGNVSMRPGKATVFPSKDDVWTIESDARFDISVEVMRDERLEVRRAFHEDDLQLKESPQMTATEVQARKDQMNRALGSPVARLQTDVLEPIVMIVLDHLHRAGRVPPPPDSMKGKRSKLKLRCRGPIARAQLMDEVVAIERSAAFIATLVKLGFPEARHRLDLDATIKEHAKRLGSPAAMYRSPADAKRREDEERRMMAEAQAAKTAKDAGQAMAAMASAGAAPAAGGGAFGIGEQAGLVPSGGVPA